jgi:hypothetical protein
MQDPGHASEQSGGYAYLLIAQNIFGQFNHLPPPENLWATFNVHRRSAEYYLDCLFDSLDRIAAWTTDGRNTVEGPSTPIAETSTLGEGGSELEREMIEIKGCVKAIISDLILTENAITTVRLAHSALKPSMFAPIPAFWYVIHLIFLCSHLH